MSSHDHATNILKLLYKELGFEIDKEELLGKTIEKEFGQSVERTDHSFLYVFLDEIIVLYKSFAPYFLFIEHSKFPSAIVFYRLCIRQMRTLLSIRFLCGYGFDTNARMQLRLLFETALLWLRLRIDDQCLKDYMNCKNLKDSKEFWYKYLSKGKNESFIRKSLEDKNIAWGDYKDIFDDIKTLTNEVAHPSPIADFVDARTDWNNMNDFNFLLTDSPSVESHFTITCSLFISTIPFFLKPDIPYPFKIISSREKNIIWNPIPHPTTSYQTYFKLLSDMILRIVLFQEIFTVEYIKKSD